MIAGQVISQRSLLRAKGELTYHGVDFLFVLLEKMLASFDEGREPLYTFTIYTPVASSAIYPLVISTTTGLDGMFAGYLGFVSLVIILIMMTLSQWFAKEDSRGVTRRMLILPQGKALSFMGDVLLLFAIGSVIVILAFLGSVSLGGMEMVYLIAYVYFITGLCLVLSRFQEAGSIDILAPLIALFTSVLGGAFMNLGALSPMMQTLSFLTPQGQMLYGVSHGVFWNLWVLIGGGTLLLIIVYRYSNRKR
jgi:hypothetical protein